MFKTKGWKKEKFRTAKGTEFVAFKKNDSRWAILGENSGEQKKKLGKYSVMTSFGLQPKPTNSKKVAMKQVNSFIKEMENK